MFEKPVKSSLRTQKTLVRVDAIFNLKLSVFRVFLYKNIKYSRSTICFLVHLKRSSSPGFCLFSQKLQKLGVSTSPLKPQTPPREHSLPPRPQSLILGAPVLSRKEVQREEDEEVFGVEAREDVPISTGGERTVEGSSATENGYMELPGSFGSKSEPAVVTLEFGVARMTC